MSKHDKTFATDAINPDLLRRTETAILDFMAHNEGTMPTQSQINEQVKTSYSRLGPAVRTVKARLLEAQTKLANTPDIPGDLLRMHHQMLKDLWARTRELQNGEIVDLRRAQAMKDDERHREMAESQQIIEMIEQEKDRQSARAEAAEADAVSLRELLQVARTELADAKSRLSEREAIFAMLAPRAGTEPNVSEVSTPMKTSEPPRRLAK